MTEWLELNRGDLPLVVSMPHTGTDIPREMEEGLVSVWTARKDNDWWVHRLYDWAGAMGATTLRTNICRTVIDVNRDPSGASVYPGQAEDRRFSRVTDGRFRGGWTARHHGSPSRGVHAVQMELACRGYLDEPDVPSQDNWPPRYEASRAEPLRTLLERVLGACIDFTRVQRGHST